MLGEVERSGELAALFVVDVSLRAVLPPGPPEHPELTGMLFDASVCWAPFEADVFGDPDLGDLGEGLARLGLREPLEFTLEW